MNNQRRKQLAHIQQEIDNLQSAMQDVIVEEQEAWENLPESIQMSNTGDQMEEVISDMQEIADDLIDMMDRIFNVIER